MLGIITFGAVVTEFWFWLVLILLTMVLSGMAQKSFANKMNVTSSKPNTTGKAGYQIAQEILAKNGISDVKVVPGHKPMGDNYNPMNNTITLSPDVYNSASIAAEAIVAHEVGHAIQWKEKHVFIRIRNLFLKPAQAGAKATSTFLMLGLILALIGGGLQAPGNTGVQNTQGSVLAWWFIVIAASGMALVLLFQIATLPVEFNATKKAKQNLHDMNYYRAGSDEEKEASSILTAAAMTYVVAVIAALAQLGYWLLLILSARGRR